MIAEFPAGISPTLRRPGATHPSFWVLACLLLAWVQITWAGYQLGVGNQAIQISFVETLHNPRLFSRDVMVQSTLSQYPSMFPRLGVQLLTLADLPTLYLALHLLATAGVFLAVAAWSRSLGSSHWAGLVALLLLVAGHHQALAGETLYSTGLTHTWVVFPLCLLALGFFFRDSYWLAFALAGAIFNLHALEAGYVAWVLGVVSLGEVRRVGFWKLLGLVGVFLLAAAPTLRLMIVAQRQAQFDAGWLQLMHLRSADHSFPSSWWQAGNSDIPRLAGIVSLAGLALGFPLPAPQRRKILLAAAAIGLLFVGGYVFTELCPIPLIIRAQLFRSSRLLVVLALLLIAHGCVGGWRLVWHRPPGMPRWRAGLEVASATLTALTLAIPPLLVLLPAALVLAVAVALLNARVAWYQAFLAGVTILVCLAAWQSLHFLLPGLSPEITWRVLLAWRGPSLLAWTMLAGAGLLWILAVRSLPRWGRVCIGALGVGVLVGLTMLLFPRILQQPAPDAPWVEVQRWARGQTPVDAVFLTPPQQGNFRVYAQRAVVGEWRDGTQLYFNPAFAAPWWECMKALQPGMVLDVEGNNLLSRGRALAQLDDAQIIALAQRYHADYVVLPPSDRRTLRKVYDNKVWAVYRPLIAPLETGPGEDPQAAQESFLQQTVLPNIEKNRKSDVRVQVVDAVGRPIDSVRFRLAQTSSPFAVGCSLPFFKAPAVDFHGDYQPPAVTLPELARFLELFSYSVTPFSGQWMFIEPQEGKRDYTDLDQYVEWCEKHGIRVELKALGGNPPAWLKNKNKDERARLFLAHAQDLVKRYGSRIDSWEVVDEKSGLEQAPEVFAALRKLAPQIRLGIADDARFWSPRQGVERQADMLRGLEQVRALQKQGVPVDFFGFHGHRPLGLWADAREIYSALDACAKEGLRVHVTEVGVPLGARIEGPVRDDRWTPQLQADYYTRFLTICFSHPSVEVVNFFGIGPKTWIEGEGLVDETGEPTPAFAALQKLVLQQWRTDLSGTLGLDGVVSFRGFHGAYTLTVTLPSGRSCTVPLSVLPGQTNTYRFQLDVQVEKLTRWEGR